ncbi:MAG: hypothetical protein AB1642_01755 [Pseudomonadota bacterium]
MKRLAFACALAWAGAGSAQDAAAPQGYSFEQPELLADQHVWGIVHGARLLAQACARASHGGAAEAWVDWQEREAAQIGAMRVVLSRHYFRTDDASPDALAAALGLKQALALPAGELGPACATLAEALAQPRYDLSKRREEVLAKFRK